MDRGITIIISIIVGVAVMSGVAIFGFETLAGSMVSVNIMPVSMEVISMDRGNSLMLSVALANQGSATIERAFAVLSANDIGTCRPGSSQDEMMCGGAGEKSVLSRESIHFPIWYTTEPIGPYGTVSIRGTIMPPTSGSYGADTLGCGASMEDSAGNYAKIDPAAGFSSLGHAMTYLSGDPPGLKFENTELYSNGLLMKNANVFCTRELGVHPGEGVVLTIVAITTSGDRVERILPIIVK